MLFVFSDRSIDIALLSITACGTGLNLTCASIVIFAELSWSVGQILQAEDRVHRIGQSANSVRIIYILAGWSDDIVWVIFFCILYSHPVTCALTFTFFFSLRSFHLQRQIERKHEVLAATVGIGSYESVGASNPQKKYVMTGEDKAQTTLTKYMSSYTTERIAQQDCEKSKSEEESQKRLVPAPSHLSSYDDHSNRSCCSREPILSLTCCSMHGSETNSDRVHEKISRSPTLDTSKYETSLSIRLSTNQKDGESAVNQYQGENSSHMPAGSNKRPLSPATKMRIEESRLRAIEKRKKLADISAPLMHSKNNTNVNLTSSDFASHIPQSFSSRSSSTQPSKLQPISNCQLFTAAGSVINIDLSRCDSVEDSAIISKVRRSID